MSKENGVTMFSASYQATAPVRRVPYGAAPSERDTDPDITKDYIMSVPAAPPTGTLAKARVAVARILARLSWMIMP